MVEICPSLGESVIGYPFELGPREVSSLSFIKICMHLVKV